MSIQFSIGSVDSIHIAHRIAASLPVMAVNEVENRISSAGLNFMIDRSPFRLNILIGTCAVRVGLVEFEQ